MITLKKEKALGDGYVRLTLEKAKGVKFDAVNLQLDFARRTFMICSAAPPPPTPFEIIAKTVTREMATVEIVAALKKLSIGERSAKDYLGAAVDKGVIRKTRHGWYAPSDAPVAPDVDEEEECEWKA